MVLRDTALGARPYFIALAALVAGCEPVIPPPPFGGARDATTADAATSDARDAIVTPPDTILCRELPGDLIIASPEDLAALDYVRVVDGDLLFRPHQGIWNMSVREVTGRVRILGSASDRVGAHVTLAALSAIGGDLEVGTTVKGLVDIYRLDHLGGSLVAQDGGWAFWTPALRAIGGGVEVRDASWLALTLDALESLGGPVRIERAAGLASLSLGKVTALHAPADEDALALVDLPDLAALHLDTLETIDGGVRVTGNPKLSRAAIDLALAPVTVRGPRVICGNLDDEACP